jgi:adenylate kinase
MELQDKNLRKEKVAVILMGPVTAGKGTQADLLTEDFGLSHLETSRVIREKFADADPNDQFIKAERDRVDGGELATPSLVLKWILERMEIIANEGLGIVFSSSPRTVVEAKGEFPILEKYYGKENVKVVFINISEAEAIKRATGRRVCAANSHPIPNFPEFKDMKTCPKDGSELIRKAGGLDDNIEIIKKRYNGFAPDMHAVIDFAKQQGFEVIELNGEQSIEAVHDGIVSHLFKLHASDHEKILSQAVQ